MQCGGPWGAGIELGSATSQASAFPCSLSPIPVVHVRCFHDRASYMLLAFLWHILVHASEPLLPSSSSESLPCSPCWPATLNFPCCYQHTFSWEPAQTILDQSPSSHTTPALCLWTSVVFFPLTSEEEFSRVSPEIILLLLLCICPWFYS